MKKEKVDLNYWAETCPVSYLVVNGLLLFGLDQIVYYILFVKLGF